MAPDFDVELDPAKYRLGQDAQLDKAIAVVMELMQQHPQPAYARPAYPNYHPNDGLSLSPKAGSRTWAGSPSGIVRIKILMG